MNIDDIKKVKEMTDLGLKEEDIKAYLESDRTKTVEEFISSLDSHEQHSEMNGYSHTDPAKTFSISENDIDEWVQGKSKGIS
jgi:hypothetical protein